VQDAHKAAEEALKNQPKLEFSFFDKIFDFDPSQADLAQKQIKGLLEAAHAFRKEFGSGTGLAGGYAGFSNYVTGQSP
jgi:hypothetical protein